MKGDGDMAHVQHFQRSDIARLGHEWNRDKRADGKWQFRPTGEIDSSRTHMNYRMETEGVKKALENRLNEGDIQVARRKDLTVVSSWVVTCPEAIKQDPALVKRFFQDVYDFTCERYGRENVLNGYVHLDETSPHIHMPVIPVVRDKETGKKKVCRKELFTRKELKGYHDDLDAALVEKGWSKGLVVNGRTKGNYTTAELKERDRIDREQKKRQEQLDRREQVLKQREDAVKAQERALQARRQQLEEKAARDADEQKKAVETLKQRYKALCEEESKAIAQMTELGKQCDEAVKAIKTAEGLAAAKRQPPGAVNRRLLDDVEARIAAMRLKQRSDGPSL